MSSKVCVPNKTKDLNLIWGINESKTSTKDISLSVNLNLIEENVIQISGEIMINIDVRVKKFNNMFV